MKYYLIFGLAFGLILSKEKAYGQESTNNNDLRKPYNLFFIKDYQQKKNIVYKMNSTKVGQFNLTIEEDDKIINNKKLNSVDAQKIDEDFVDKFISFKYLMKAKDIKKCEKSFFLNLRGEELTICQDENDKLIEMKALVEKMKKEFL